MAHSPQPTDVHDRVVDSLDSIMATQAVETVSDAMLPLQKLNKLLRRLNSPGG